ncbi:MAG: PEP-CTERM sorting domain-containing protein [Thermodesulfobacteriota bacterium]|nr:PEP-CTERM sorting domain-containing protein [Thermodesulfobacteriota bacterium]
MKKTHGKVLIVLLAFFTIFIVLNERAQAALMHTTITAQIHSFWSAEPASLGTGDTVFAEIIYDDGDISHEPYNWESMDLLRRYQNVALVTLDPKILAWTNQAGMYPQNPMDGIYRLYEPDGTELNEFFIVDSRDFLLSIYHSFGTMGNEMHFDFTGQHGWGGELNASILSIVSTPIQTPEPASMFLFASGLVPLFLRRKGKQAFSHE